MLVFPLRVRFFFISPRQIQGTNVMYHEGQKENQFRRGCMEQCWKQYQYPYWTVFETVNYLYDVSICWRYATECFPSFLLQTVMQFLSPLVCMSPIESSLTRLLDLKILMPLIDPWLSCCFVDALGPRLDVKMDTLI